MTHYIPLTASLMSAVAPLPPWRPDQLPGALRSLAARPFRETVMNSAVDMRPAPTQAEWLAMIGKLPTGVLIQHLSVDDWAAIQRAKKQVDANQPAYRIV